MGESSLGIVFLLLAAIGWIGSIVPALPGLPLALGALVAYGFVTGFAEVTVSTTVISGLLTVLNYVVAYFLGAQLARRYGKVKVPAIAIFLGSILGLMALGPFGFIIGPVLVVFAVALISGVGPTNGVRSAVAVAISMGISVIMEFLVSSWILYVLLAAVVFR